MKDQEQKEQQQLLKVHQTLFAANLAEETIQLLDQEQKLNVFGRNGWKIDHGDFNNKKWNCIFAFMISASCSELWLNQNYEQKIIMSISKTNFMELKQLSLSGNNITSIEQLQFINMPLLEELCLSKKYNKPGQNKITKTSALHKCKWNNLNELYLHNNQNQNVEIERLKIGNKECGPKYYSGVHQNTLNVVMMMAKMNFSKLFLQEKLTQIHPLQKQLQSLRGKGLTCNLMD